jgi:hypothetical protein
MEEKTPVKKIKRKSRIIKMRIHFLQELSRISRIPNVPQIIIATSDKKTKKFFQIKRIYPPSVESMEYSRYVPT